LCVANAGDGGRRMRRMGMRRRVVMYGIRVGREARIWSLIRMRIEILVSALILKHNNGTDIGRRGHVGLFPQIIGGLDFWISGIGAFD
jgi:hypothetical protein